MSWCLLILILLAGCQSSPNGFPINSGQTIIDWVDFIKWNGKDYNGVYTGVLADESYIGEKVGEVQFKVADNVTNPSYRTKDGDAAFHEPGTELFSIKGRDDLIAVKSDHAINGYKVYYLNEGANYNWHYKSMPAEKVEKVQIHQDIHMDGYELLNEMTKKEDIEEFLKLLNEGTESPMFNPNTSNGDPIIYDMVFYTDEPIAYHFTLFYDGVTYYWHPWDTSVLSIEIKSYIEPIN